MPEPPRYYLDEDVRRSQAVADGLRRRGIDVMTTVEAGRADQGIPDPDQLSFAVAHGRVFVTEDLRFAPVGLHAGVVVMQWAVDVGAYVRFLDYVAHAFTAEEMRNRILYYNRRLMEDSNES